MHKRASAVSIIHMVMILQKKRNNLVGLLSILGLLSKPIEGFSDDLKSLQFEIIGVSSEKQHLYVPDENGKFHCLNDSSIVLDFSQINDGICDCPDGSDEPGTGICGEATLFYCQNDGFKPRYISGSKVGDGICDCCDCSDELIRMQSESGNGSLDEIKGTLENKCSILNDKYNEMIEKEYEIYAKGIKSFNDLKKYYKIETVEEKLQDGEMESQSIKNDIDELTKEYQMYDKMVKDEKEKFGEQLKSLNPVLYEFENLDLNYLEQVLIQKFDDLKKADKLFREINDVMEDLKGSYTKSMHDKAVNSNIEKYNKLYSTYNLKKMYRDVNADVDEEQKVQLLDYLTYELPKLFSNGIDLGDFDNDVPYYNEKDLQDDKFKTVKYSVGKINFVRSLLIGRFNYSKKVIEVIDELLTILDDIANNYNVNVQDKGVLSAINSYKGILDQYNELNLDIDGDSKSIVLPSKFIAGLDELHRFINEKVPTFLEIDQEVDNDCDILEDKQKENGGNFFNKLNNFFGNVKDELNQEYAVSLLKALRRQIETHESELLNIGNKLEVRKEELNTLNKYTDNDQENNEAKKHILIKEYSDLLKKIKSKGNADDLFCIVDTVDNYSYDICFDSKNQGHIYQKELKNNGNVVLIGDLTSIDFDNVNNTQENITNQKYIEYLNLKYNDPDETNDLYLLDQLINETGEIGSVNYLIDDLYETNSGVKLKFENGHKCWNGPQRSAIVLIKCHDTFEIKNVQETTKCNYLIEINGPLGCSSNLSIKEKI